MAWTAPRTWAVGEIVTKALMDTHVRDNLRYLKGMDGAVAIEAALSVAVNTNASSGVNITNSSAGSSAFAHINIINDGGVAAGFFRNSSTATAYAGVNSLNIMMIGAHPLALGTNNTVRQLIDSSGNVGFGTTSPQGRIHATGAGGAFMYLSASAVTSLQTIAVAGTVTAGATFYIMDRNNTSGTVVVGTTGVALQLGGSSTYTNTDTITYAITAGGAITVQRTAGTNGTHNVNMLVLAF